MINIVTNSIQNYELSNRSFSLIDYLAVQVLNKMVEPGARKKLMEHLSETEVNGVRKAIGENALQFSRHNPTGRYQLNLHRKEQREVFIQIILTLSQI